MFTSPAPCGDKICEASLNICTNCIADCLKNLHVKNGSVKFLGSYPAAGDENLISDKATVKSEKADSWLDELRGRIGK